MTELPEIEILSREAKQYLIGHKIVRYEWLYTRQPSPGIENICNKTISNVTRKGKLLLINFDDGSTLAIHLMMVGQLLLAPPFQGEAKDICLLLQLENGSILTVGQVNYGIIRIINPGEHDCWDGLTKLGIDPLSKEFTEDYVYGIISKKRSPIKSLLLNQRWFPGLGNTYVDEILFTAGIHPQRYANSLTAGEIEKLFKAILLELDRGLAMNGSSEMEFVHLDGSPGDYQNHFRVKRREGRPCSKCSAPIIRQKIGGHGTYLCPVCQPLNQGNDA